MRILSALPLLALAACNVSEGNNSVTVSYNQDVAENAVADVAAGAKEAGAAIANGAEEAGEAVANGAETAADKARNVDIDVDTNTADNR